MEYEGTRFAGWAAQPGLRTVEGELGAALERILGGPPVIRVAGRTDAGVHATGQVVSVLTASDREPTRILRALRGLLPADLAVRSVTEAPAGFDARADARSRAYEYRVLAGPPSPLRRRFVLLHPPPLDLEALAAAAAAVRGTHDFRAFTPTQTEHVFFDRTVLAAAWERRGDELVFAIEADAFLRHMVRVLVGSMLLVGRGHWALERFTRLLAGAPRTQAGPTAPAHALTLVAVRYAATSGSPSPGPAAAPGTAR
ncbi:MAG TPA: tRNA pseudouridine(38-40) synthase TruA [Miltoncostaeaceae bacterium]|nr:tRNA pseudouridine(38-40) synthase TruA [Miltoncostaeaceae bacterium]